MHHVTILSPFFDRPTILSPPLLSHLVFLSLSPFFFLTIMPFPPLFLQHHNYEFSSSPLPDPTILPPLTRPTNLPPLIVLPPNHSSSLCQFSILFLFSWPLYFIVCFLVILPCVFLPQSCLPSSHFCFFLNPPTPIFCVPQARSCFAFHTLSHLSSSH